MTTPTRFSLSAYRKAREEAALRAEQELPQELREAADNAVDMILDYLSEKYPIERPIPNRIMAEALLWYPDTNNFWNPDVAYAVERRLNARPDGPFAQAMDFGLRKQGVYLVVAESEKAAESIPPMETRSDLWNYNEGRGRGGRDRKGQRFLDTASSGTVEAATSPSAVLSFLIDEKTTKGGG
jgi:hypothetical protein